MTELQNYFEEFHNNIKLNDENAILREKRDIILDKLDDRLKKLFKERDETPPSYTHFNRGSYAMGTGVIPINGDYDIDIGVVFDLCKEDYSDPVVAKQWVYDALVGHTHDVKIKQPCITIQYQLEDDPIYHVDLAVYMHDRQSQEKLYLARGKPYSTPEYKVWQPTEPKEFIELIRNRFQDTKERAQFRRVIRYLKRWKNIKFSTDGNAAPIGIGITVAAYYWLVPQRILVDVFQNRYKDNDLATLQKLIEAMLRNFALTFSNGEMAERLRVQLPVKPNNDLFEKMTNLQMTAFKEKLVVLQQALQNATNEPDPVEACQLLQMQFGDDFPVPDIDETGQKRGRAIVSSSASA